MYVHNILIKYKIKLFIRARYQYNTVVKDFAKLKRSLELKFRRILQNYQISRWTNNMEFTIDGKYYSKQNNM